MIAGCLSFNGDCIKVQCNMCDKEYHETKSCPWVYSRCKHIPCNGVRALLRSKTDQTNGRTFFKCLNPTCNYFEWFDLASSPTTALQIKLPSPNCCIACGEENHFFNNCPLQNQSCFKQNCNSKLELKVCKHNVNIAYLVCKKKDCDAFRWASDALVIETKETLKGKVLEICDEFKKNLKM